MNYFDVGDIVECIVPHAGWGFKQGMRLQVMMANGSGVPSIRCQCGCGPGGGGDMRCDDPLSARHFMLYQKAAILAGPHNPPSSQPTSALVSPGAWVCILDVSASGLPPGAIGDVVIVRQVDTATMGPLNPRVLIEWKGLQAWLRDDQYVIPSPKTPVPGPYPTSFQPGSLGATLAGGGTVGMDEAYDRPRTVQIVTKNRRCECGSEKVGSPQHSTWCPKHSGGDRE